MNVIGHHDDEPHDGVRGFFTGVGGTTDKQAGASGGLEYGFKNWLVRGSASAQRTGDFDTPVGVIPNSASRSNALSFGTGYYGNKVYIGGSYGYDVRRYGIPFAALFEEEKTEGELPVVDEDIDVRARQHRARINGGFRNLVNEIVSGVQYNLDYSDYRHKEIERSEGVDNVGTIFDNKTFSYRAVFEQAKRGPLTGRFGFEGFSRDYEVNGEEQLIQGKINHDAFSVFGLEELNFDRVKFQFGGRVEHNRYDPVNTDLLNRSISV